jgi:hypothetical protein
MMRNSARGWMGLLAALMLAPAAGALNITGLAVATTGANTADSTSTSNNLFSEVASTTTVIIAPSGPVADTVGSALTFQTRYQWLVEADRENNGAGGLSNTATAAYQITFTVDNPMATTYRIDIDTSRLGSLTVFDDPNSGNASVTIGAVSGTVDAITQAALALATIPAVTTTTTINQSSTTLSITSSATSHLYTIAFTWNGTATSNNDEAAIRMGLAGALAGVSADDYPGQGARTAANDGHFVTVSTTILSAPEPEPVALVALGLVALAIRARRIRD